MASINSVVVSGRATRDPEIREFDGGGKVANLGIAVDRSVKQGDEWTTTPNFFDISVFGNYADLIHKKVRKGDLISVEGELRWDQWEKDGEKRTKVYIVAKSLDGEFSYRKADGSDTPARSESDTPAAAPAAAPAPATDAIPF